jgi:hypothetical protein
MKTSNRFISSVAAVCCVASVVSVAFAADSAAVASHLKSYTASGEALLSMANSKKVDVAELDKRVDGMVADGIWMAEEYLKVKPEATKWFQAVFANIPAIKKLPAEEIEKQWHDGHHFDGKEKEIGINHQDEKNEHFRDPLDSVTHPLIIQRAGRDFAEKKDEASLKMMKENAAEALEQVKKAALALSKK